jgi:hypothetical protein
MILAVVHLAIVLAFIFFAARGSRDAQWELAFLPLALLDLPVAMPAYLLGFGVVWALAGFGVFPEAAIAMVAVANGLVGTAFYLILPPAISAHRRFRHGLHGHESAVA